MNSHTSSNQFSLSINGNPEMEATVLFKLLNCLLYVQ